MVTSPTLEESLSQIDLRRFHEVIEHLLPAPVALAISLEKRVVASFGDGANEVSKALSAMAPELSAEETSGEPDSTDTRLVAFPFEMHGGPCGAHLIVRHGRDDHLDTAALLQPLFDCMQSELRLADEIISMADELTSRYEELNLVYDTQDQASDYEETQHQLSALVKNCSGYLNVSFAALVLPEKDVTIYELEQDIENTEVLVAIDMLQGQMFQWVAASKEIAVVNDVNDQLGAVLCTGVPYKVIAAPILSGANDVSGMLVLARTYADESFTNNDKNLADVMSRKASKIIQASFDSQTGFMKRSGFEYMVNRALQSARVVGMTHAVFVIDIDRMQVLNDTLGYDAGDLVIDAVAKTLQSSVRSHDSIARLGGDEFGVLVSDCPVDVAKNIAVKIAEAIEQLKLAWQSKPIETSVSIGVVPLTATSKDVSTEIAAAEVACSAVKDRGGNDVSLYLEGDEELVRRRSYMDLVGRIQDTLRTDRFELYCQPIVALQPNDDLLHVEVLIRMRDENDEIISPAGFIPAAERYHLMPAIDRWVVAKSIAILAEQGLTNVLVSINLSGQSLSDESFIPFVEQILEKSAARADRLCFEITETTAISDIAQAQKFIAAFRRHGIQFSLDDFGTGLSSFTYLKQLDVDFLKIDGSFVKEICVDPVAETMVSAINKVGHTMNLKTVGEFVENDAIMERLTTLGVDYGQGYGIAKPSPFAAYLADLAEAFKVRDAG